MLFLKDAITKKGEEVCVCGVWGMGCVWGVCVCVAYHTKGRFFLLDLLPPITASTRVAGPTDWH